MKARPSRFRDERGVFVPGLMGAGILVSIVMLVTDGIRKLFPVRGDRARAARVRAVALGRANDLRAVGRGEPPEPARVLHVPRSRGVSVILGMLALAAAVAVLAGTQSYFNSDLIDLAGREEWGFGLGWGASFLLAAGGVIWLASGALGKNRPELVERLASLPALGELPDPYDPLHPVLTPYVVVSGDPTTTQEAET